MYEHESEPPITSTPHQAPSTGNTDLNARSVDSSEENAQTAIEIGLPYVQQDIPLPRPRNSFDTLQTREGVVTAVEGQSFSVKLVDLSGDEPDEEAEIGFEDVSVDERHLVAIGAVFLLHVGYATSEGGQRIRMSILRFRRLPVWTEAELSTARRIAQEQAETIRWT